MLTIYRGIVDTYQFALGVGHAFWDLFWFGLRLDLAKGAAQIQRRTSEAEALPNGLGVLLMSSLLLTMLVHGETGNLIANVLTIGSAVLKRTPEAIPVLIYAISFFIAGDLGVRFAAPKSDNPEVRKLVVDAGRLILSGGMLWAAIYCPIATWALDHLLAALPSATVGNQSLLAKSYGTAGDVIGAVISVIVLMFPILIVGLNMSRWRGEAGHPIVGAQSSVRSWVPILAVIMAYGVGAKIFDLSNEYRAPAFSGECKLVDNNTRLLIAMSFKNEENATYSTLLPRMFVIGYRSGQDVGASDGQTLSHWHNSQVSQANWGELEVPPKANATFKFKVDVSPLDEGISLAKIDACVLRGEGPSSLQDFPGWMGRKPPRFPISWIRTRRDSEGVPVEQREVTGSGGVLKFKGSDATSEQ